MARFLPLALTVGWLVALSVWDLKERRVPNRLVLFAYASLGLSLLVEWWVFHAGASLPLFLLAGAGLFAMGVVVQFLTPDGLGGGDIKVFGLMGFGMGALGFEGLILGEIAAGVYVTARWLFRHRPLRDPIPLVPFLAIGSLLVGVWNVR